MFLLQKLFSKGVPTLGSPINSHKEIYSRNQEEETRSFLNPAAIPSVLVVYRTLWNRQPYTSYLQNSMSQGLRLRPHCLA